MNKRTMYNYYFNLHLNNYVINYTFSNINGKSKKNLANVLEKENVTWLLISDLFQVPNCETLPKTAICIRRQTIQSPFTSLSYYAASLNERL